ncbi:MAG: hypothetical protein HQL06_10825 [Nitrospirae bacterium]|nr:hypothetical protein [Nitrospirota bacterium]
MLITEILNRGDKYLIDKISSLEIPRDKSAVISNTLGKSKNIDSISQILQNRYKLTDSNIWLTFFGTDYEYANRILYLAERSFDMDKNAWTNYMDTFNDIVVRKFITVIKSKTPDIKCPSITDKNNTKLDIGTILDKQHKLWEIYPKLHEGLFELHERRRTTLVSHAYEKKTGKRASIVTTNDRSRLYGLLKVSYMELLQILTTP